MGKKIVHCGGAGAGQAAKICNNMILGISMIAVSEAFALAEKLGLSHQALFDVASTSSGQCWSLTSYCPVPGPVPTSPANNDYKPGFASALMVKDLTLAQDAAKAAGAATPLGKHAQEIYKAFDAAGNGGVDFSGIIQHVRGSRREIAGKPMTTFQEARAFLLKHRTDYDKAVAGFRWPDPVPFNWALDWFDAELARNADSKDRPALWIVDAGSNRETKLSFEALSRRSNQVANFLRAQGLKRGDHLLLLLGNVVPLWETMLAAIKLGVVVIPATTLLTPDELRDRLDRGRAKVVVASQDQVAKFAGLGGDQLIRIVVEASSKQDGWLAVRAGRGVSGRVSRRTGRPAPNDPMLLYFTSGTTAKPKLVRHSQRSYPVGGAVDDVLARAAARRRPSEHFLAGLGQARLELLLRALECRRHRVRGQPAALRRQGIARDHRPLRRHHAVRAADGVAAVHPGEACDLQGLACAKSAAPASRSIPK